MSDVYREFYHISVIKFTILSNCTEYSKLKIWPRMGLVDGSCHCQQFVRFILSNYSPFWSTEYIVRRALLLFWIYCQEGATTILNILSERRYHYSECIVRRALPLFWIIVRRALPLFWIYCQEGATTILNILSEGRYHYSEYIVRKTLPLFWMYCQKGATTILNILSEGRYHYSEYIVRRALPLF